MIIFRFYDFGRARDGKHNLRYLQGQFQGQLKQTRSFFTVFCF